MIRGKITGKTTTHDPKCLSVPDPLPFTERVWLRQINPLSLLSYEGNQRSLSARDAGGLTSRVNAIGSQTDKSR